MANSSDGTTLIAKFVLSVPAQGMYAPWRNSKDAGKWYAGETITIEGTRFHYREFTDAMGGPPSDYSGRISVFKNHVVFHKAGEPDFNLIAGLADGRPVLLAREGYLQWKKSGKVSEVYILYLEKASKSKN